MKETIGLDFFAKLQYPCHLAARGKTLYFLCKRVDVSRNAYDSDLYRWTDGKTTKLTSSGDVRTFALLDEGIVFPALRNEKDKKAAKDGRPLTVFQLLPYDGGEAREYLRLDHSIQQTEWLPGGGLLFRAALNHTFNRFADMHNGDMDKTLEALKEEREALTVVDELPFWFNGEGFINKIRTALYHYDGQTVQLLSDPFANVSELKLNESRTKALFAQTRYETVAPLESELYELHIATNKIAPAGRLPEGMIDTYAYQDDAQALVLFTPSDHPQGLSAANPALYRVNLLNGTATALDESGQYNYCDGTASDIKMGTIDHGLTVTGSEASFLCTLQGESHVLRYSLSEGSFTQITQAPGTALEHIPYGDGYAMCAMRDNLPNEIYLLTADGAEKRITDFNDAVMAAYEIVTPVPVSYTSQEGIDIHGWVMPPVGYVPGKQYPTILNIHGGPKSAYTATLFHEMQYWCGQGYTVLFCNPTGSDGRGSAFADIRGRYGTVDYTDIMGFVDACVRQFGFIDPSRMGVTGGSYGGYMTNWIIGHTDRFKAAASQRSIANWLGFNNTSDIGYFFGKDQMMGTPWDIPKALWNASPLKYADKAKTPTLFIHSEEDYRCNMFEGIQMFYALRLHGVETRLCLFKGENHELSRSGKPKNRIRRIDEITRWMDRYLKK